MGQLVEHDRGEQTDRAAGGHDPPCHRRKVRKVVGEQSLGQRPGDEHGDNKPAQVDPDRKAEEFEEFKSPGEHALTRSVASQIQKSL